MGARRPRADRRARRAPARRRTPRRSRTPRSAPSATRSSPRSAPKNLVDVRSPDEYAGRLLAPAHLPQEQAQRAGHIPTAVNVPWSKAANDDGTFKSDDELHEALRRRRPRLAARTPSPTAASASAPRTPGSCCTELLGQQNVQELRRLLDRVRLPGRRARRARRRAGRRLREGRPDVRRDDGRARRCDGVDVAKEAVIQGRVLARRRAGAATPTCGCSTAPVSSPPRCRPRRPATSGSSPRRASGRCAPWPRRRPGRPPGRRRRRRGRRGRRRAARLTRPVI